MANSHLLISDVDGTLLGDDEALEHFARWYAEHGDRMRLVYCSGRFVSSLVKSIESTLLPAPDAVIGGVGTEMRSFPSMEPIGDWLVAGDGWQPLRICSVLSQFDELQLQPAEFLSDYKISYFAEGASTELLADIHDCLFAAKCRVELVFSSQRDLDVLPAGINKGSAARYLATRWSYAQNRVFVSGDTENDLALFENGFRGIVVGNARDSLRRLDSSNIYQARSAHAAGVLEGLSHWFGCDKAL